MVRKKPKTRRKAHANPKGIFECNPQGFGFVKTSEGDFFIPSKYANTAFDGDTVEIAPVRAKRSSTTHQRKKGRSSSKKEDSKRAEARVVRVLERAHTTVVGRYEVAGPFGVVIPDDKRITHDIFTLRRDNPDIEDGSIVKVRILEYPTRKTSATGTVEEVLGKDGDTGLAVERIISRYDLETEFSEGALSEADDAVLDVEGALCEGYRDIRSRFVFTIDPADAKDFDDAISLEKMESPKDIHESAIYIDRETLEKCFAANSDTRDFKEGGQKATVVYRLGIHIADVSHYVQWGSSIDLDARRRATSVYLVDRVIPMLPEKLSNGLCSLRPLEDRLCMTADLYIDDNADLLAYDLYPALMRSDIRLTYDEVLDMLKGKKPDVTNSIEEKPASEKTSALVCRLRKASELAKARQRWRQSQGGIEFQTKEAKVCLNAEGEPVGVVVREKNDATELIEEAMIFANEVVAAHLFAGDWPCAYRDHERPGVDALSELLPVLQEFPWFKKSHSDGLLKGNPHTIQKILRESEGRGEADMVTMMFLRSMMRAVYSPVNEGHYGLGLKAYCHFTSPIRRYPDLIVHRMLRANLTKRPEKFDQEVSSLKWLCEHSSEMERVAESASYDSQKAKMVEYMERFVGQRFEAVISGVASYGLYVRLDNCAEGLVPVRSLGDEYFIYDPVKQMLKGSDSAVAYRLGQYVDVVLTQADLVNSRLDFNIA